MAAGVGIAYTNSIVADFDGEVAIVHGCRDTRCVCFRVFGDVCEGLGAEVVDAGLDCGGKSGLVDFEFEWEWKLSCECVQRGRSIGQSSTG